MNALERERFDLAAVVRAASKATASPTPPPALRSRAPAKKGAGGGTPDLAAQLLDKLVANAVDFSARGRTYRISLFVENGVAELGVGEPGAAAAEEMRGKLFESMVSVPRRARARRKSGEPPPWDSASTSRVLSPNSTEAPIAARNARFGRRRRG